MRLQVSFDEWINEKEPESHAASRFKVEFFGAMGVACCKGPVIDDNAEGKKSLNPVELSHFTLLRSIGKGAFGKVSAF